MVRFLLTYVAIFKTWFIDTKKSCENTLGQNQFFSNLEFCLPTKKKTCLPSTIGKMAKGDIYFFSIAKFAQMILHPPESRFFRNLRFVIRSQNNFSIKLRISLKQPFFKCNFHHLGMIGFQKFQRGNDRKGPKYILSP